MFSCSSVTSPGSSLHRKGENMGIRELREIYGEGKSIQVLNRAVRKEIPGGQLFYEVLSLAAKKQNDSAESRELYHKLESMRKEMFEYIAQKYELKTFREKQDEQHTQINH